MSERISNLYSLLSTKNGEVFTLILSLGNVDFTDCVQGILCNSGAVPQPYSRKTNNREISRAGLMQERLYSLDGTGFNVDAQVELGVRLFEQSPDTPSFQETLIQTAREDLTSFYWEYLAQEKVLPFSLALENSKVVCPKYGNKELIDTVSPVEREGAVKCVTEELVRTLPNAKEGDAFVFTSPPEWSGYEGILYPDSQTYFYKIVDGHIQAMTIVSSMSLSQNELFIKNLVGKEIKGNNTKERIKETVKTLMKLDEMNVHDVIREIETVTGCDLTHIHNAAETNPLIDDKVAKRLTEFEVYVRDTILDMSEESQHLLANYYGKTIADIRFLTTRGRTPETMTEYRQSISEVQEIGGCGGGGEYIKTPFGPREVEYSFDVRGICRAGYKCTTPYRETWLGPCSLCESCDNRIQIGLLTLDGTEYRLVEGTEESEEPSLIQVFLRTVFHTIIDG